jgi:SAM-dependent methyltransferase
MLELVFGEAVRATTHRPHCRRHGRFAAEAIDQPSRSSTNTSSTGRLSGSACHLTVLGVESRPFGHVRLPTRIWGRLASVDASERDRLAARPLAVQRSRLFDQHAEAYDRFRPTYPDAVIDELLGPVPTGLDVLDVGCGTGIASRQIARRGAKVLGVELAPRMAEIARGHGVDLEIAAFESWDAAGRTFDRVTSAQAWHWLDLPIATAKAASVLRPGGKLCLIWNAGCQPDDLADVLEEVYSRVVPPGGHRLFRGYAASRSSDVKTGLDSEIDVISAMPDFSAPTEKWFPWTRAYQRDEWLDQLVSRSDHTALEPAVRDRLFEAIGAAIDDHGGSFVMTFETVLITATRLG